MHVTNNTAREDYRYTIATTFRYGRVIYRRFKDPSLGCKSLFGFENFCLRIMRQPVASQVGAQVVGDDQASPAIGLMQTFLHIGRGMERKGSVF